MKHGVPRLPARDGRPHGRAPQAHPLGRRRDRPAAAPRQVPRAEGLRRDGGAQRRGRARRARARPLRPGAARRDDAGAGRAGDPRADQGAQPRRAGRARHQERGGVAHGRGAGPAHHRLPHQAGQPLAGLPGLQAGLRRAEAAGHAARARLRGRDAALAGARPAPPRLAGLGGPGAGRGALGRALRRRGRRRAAAGARRLPAQPQHRLRALRRGALPALGARRRGPPAALDRRRGALGRAAPAGRAARVLRHHRLHAPGPVVLARAAARGALHGPARLLLLDPADGDALLAQRHLLGPAARAAQAAAPRPLAGGHRRRAHQEPLRAPAARGAADAPHAGPGEAGQVHQDLRPERGPGHAAADQLVQRAAAGEHGVQLPRHPGARPLGERHPAGAGARRGRLPLGHEGLVRAQPALRHLPRALHARTSPWC